MAGLLSAVFYDSARVLQPTGAPSFELLRSRPQPAWRTMDLNGEAFLLWLTSRSLFPVLQLMAALVGPRYWRARHSRRLRDSPIWCWTPAHAAAVSGALFVAPPSRCPPPRLFSD